MPNITKQIDLVNSFKTIVMPSIYSVVCVTGLVGNSLVMYILCKKVQPRSITDIYLINLTLADFLFLAMLPFWIIDLALSGRWIFGSILCKLTSASTLTHMYASVFFLTAMSVDRLLAVVFFTKSGKYRSRKIATKGAVVVWILAALLSTYCLKFRSLTLRNQTGFLLNNQTGFLLSNQTGNLPATGYFSCQWEFEGNAFWFTMHFISRTVIGFTLPFVTIATSYTIIAIFLKNRKTRGNLTSRRQDRATVLVLIVIAVFLLCWLPNQISNTIYSLQAMPHSYLQHCIHLMSTCLAWTHSCLNPFLYVFIQQDVKIKTSYDDIVSLLYSKKQFSVIKLSQICQSMKPRCHQGHNASESPEIQCVNVQRASNFYTKANQQTNKEKQRKCKSLCSKESDEQTTVNCNQVEYKNTFAVSEVQQQIQLEKKNDG
ncbi:neuropeptides B/W receptor type 1-like isoform X2 [Clavelina lepadiformis]|uniref:neuropeptides B/W receptor type 1-like isoform X2 n=1 Tax=Clavelina lepadiformis TaxID=159417 RepID=UPI004041A69C